MSTEIENDIAIKSVESFITILKLPKLIAKVLLKTVDDCSFFFKNFYKKSKEIIDDLYNYRLHKIKEVDAVISDFILSCTQNGYKATFTKFFMQHFSTFDIDIIEKKIITLEITVTSLFEDFKSNPEKNIMQYVL